MSNRTVFDKGKAYDLTVEEVIILSKVAAWFNGLTLQLHGDPVSIGNEYEPTLRQLCKDVWGDGYNAAHERLINRGLFKSADRGEDIYIAGRRCRWVPTEKCMEVIEDIFSETENLYPSWVLDEHTRPPTFRDGNELMEHRKGVLASRFLFKQCERVYSVDTYPDYDVHHLPDLRLSGAGEQLARVEVLTHHRNRETWEGKFNKWRGPKAGPTIWIYENRENMVRFWNHLVDSGLFTLDGGRFGGEPNNWSPRRVNDRLRRSRNGIAAGENSSPTYSSHDAVWTIPGVLKAGRVEAFEFLNRNNIILQS
jgi:hypothetical protein